jgi:hypothetical protein
MTSSSITQCSNIKKKKKCDERQAISRANAVCSQHATQNKISRGQKSPTHNFKYYAAEKRSSHHALAIALCAAMCRFYEQVNTRAAG